MTSVCLAFDGRYALASGSEDKTLKLYVLDWQLEDRPPADWDEGARPHLEVFLVQQMPQAASLPTKLASTEKEVKASWIPPINQLLRPSTRAPTEEEVTLSQTSWQQFQGEPV